MLMKRTTTGAFLLVALCVALPMAAQYMPAPTSAPTSDLPLPYTFSQFGHETWSFVKSPGKWDVGDWLSIGVVGAGAYLLMETADDPLRTEVLQHQQYALSAPMEFGRMWGELYAPVVIFSGYAIHSLIANDISTRKIAYEVGQASLYAGILTYAFKLAIGRSRPYVGDGPKSFHPFSTISQSQYQSFPGGHNAGAMVISTVLSRNAGSLWLKILAYVPAALTFVSRIVQDKHWLSDDFAGAALGYAVATWVVNQHEGPAPSVGLTSFTPVSMTITF